MTWWHYEKWLTRVRYIYGYVESIPFFFFWLDRDISSLWHFWALNLPLSVLEYASYMIAKSPFNCLAWNYLKILPLRRKITCFIPRQQPQLLVHFWHSVNDLRIGSNQKSDHLFLNHMFAGKIHVTFTRFNPEA